MSHATLARWDERKQSLLGQRREDWIAKNGLPPSSHGPDAPTQRTIGLAMQRIGDEPAQIVEPRVPARCRAPRAAVRMASSLRMSGARRRPRCPVSADQQQCRTSECMTRCSRRSSVAASSPLQIIEEQSERVLPLREHGDETPEQHLETILRVLRRQFRDRRLGPRTTSSSAQITMSCPFGPSASRSASRHGQALLTLPEDGRTRPGMPGPAWRTGYRLYWSKLAQSTRAPRGLFASGKSTNTSAISVRHAGQAFQGLVRRSSGRVRRSLARGVTRCARRSARTGSSW